MRRTLGLVFIALHLCLLMSCDGYKYDGMTGKQALAKANGMDLPAAYNFYIETYTKTSPPMLDVARTFDRFGAQSSAYIAARALKTDKAAEFEADMSALLILEYQCSGVRKIEFEEIADKLGVSREYILRACG